MLRIDRAEGPSIAVLAHAHPDYSKGGSEIAAYNLFCALRELGLRAVFICIIPASARRTAWNEAPDEHFVFVQPDDYEWFYHLGNPRTAKAVMRILEDNAVSTVFAHHFLNLGINTLATLKEANYKVFLTLHEFLAICHNHGQMVTHPLQTLCTGASTVACFNCFPQEEPSRFLLRKWHFQTVLEELDGLISPSAFLKQRFVEWGLAEEHVTVIENGLLPSRLDEAVKPASRRDTFLSDDTVIIGYFGQINPFKGVDLLVSAAERLEKAAGEGTRIVIRVHGNLVGLSEEFQRRFDAAQTAGTHLQYVGPYDNRDVVELMRRCDYVVMPSRWWENSPVVIQEAYAAGRPLIVGDIGGMAEKVPHMERGLHFTHNSLTSLLSALHKAADPALYARLCSAITPPPDAPTMARAYLAFADEVASNATATERARPRGGKGTALAEHRPYLTASQQGFE